MIGLDIGCGEFKQARIGVDVKPYKGVDYVVDESDYKIPLDDESIDFIICDNVLEHSNDLMILKEAYRLLTQGGAIYITVPNAYNIFAILRYILKGCYAVSYDHVHSYGYQELHNLIERSGLSCTYLCFKQRAKRFGVTKHFLRRLGNLHHLEEQIFAKGCKY